MTSPRDLAAQGSFLLEKAKRRRDTLLAAQRQSTSETGEASSSDGLVRARVDAGGMLTGLFLAPGVRQLDPRELAALITSVTQQAAAAPRAAIRRTYEQLHNEGLVKQMPALLPEPVVAPPVSRPRRPEPVEDEPDRPVLRDQGW
ncbi:YbaB/EbfC DNA-binding family protein [Lentzea waywayandensis]|uniref:YbaB/EbfC DNA-binding family protein n=1 Tax=Lentzea waywayandensis TaxID=84724 RepID=A0A1I6DN37_9PSEU|nr:YbaB/EbfC family nucleoid-associated protein [Lentzea waywayandensis]SFR06782.1 YbaB/EbfC DNA-binding family protein [Lentzea waywayandensis]